MRAGIVRGKAMGGRLMAAALSDTWLTPRHILDALDPFDLDPCQECTLAELIHRANDIGRLPPLPPAPPRRRDPPPRPVASGVGWVDYVITLMGALLVVVIITGWSG